MGSHKLTLEATTPLKLFFSPDSKCVVVVSMAVAYFYDCESGKLLDEVAITDYPPAYIKKHGVWIAQCFAHFGGPKLKFPDTVYPGTLASSEDGKWLGMARNGLEVYNLSQGTSFKIKQKDYKQHAKFTKDGSQYWVTGNTGIYGYSIPDMKMIAAIKMKVGLAGPFTLVSYQEKALVASDSGMLFEVDLNSGASVAVAARPGVEYIQEIEEVSGYCFVLSCLAEGKRDTLHAVRIINLANGKEHSLIKATKGDIHQIKLAHDGRYLAFYADNDELQILRVGEFTGSRSNSEPDAVLAEAQKREKLRNKLMAVKKNGFTLSQIYDLRATVENQASFDFADGTAKDMPENEPSKVPILLKHRHGRRMADIVALDFKIICHQKVLSLLEEKGFNGWIAHPVTLPPSFKEKDYFLLQAKKGAGPYIGEAADTSSDFRPFFDLNEWKGADIFSLKDSDRRLVTERVVKALQEAGITGWTAERVSDAQEVVAAPAAIPSIQTKVEDTKPAPIKVVGTRPAAAKVIEHAKKIGLSKISPAITKFLRSAVNFQFRAAAKGANAIGATRFGGIPDLPGGTAWPVNDAQKTLVFLAQLNLSDFKLQMKGTSLPESGIISFFVGSTAGSVWSLEDHSWKVLYHKTTKNLQRATPPDGLDKNGFYEITSPVIRPTLQIPHYYSPEVAALKLSEDETEVYMDFLDSVGEMNKRGEQDSHLLGYGWWMQSDAGETVRQEAAEVKVAPLKTKWSLLLQIDSDSELGVQWGDAGRLYFLIPDEDLKNGRFDRVWATIQS